MHGNDVDPNDPRNTGLLSMIEMIQNDEISGRGFFLTEQDDSLIFHGFDKLAYQNRLYILNYRFTNGETIRFPIPLREDQIPNSLLDKLETQIKKLKSKENILSSYTIQVREALEKKAKDVYKIKSKPKPKYVML